MNPKRSLYLVLGLLLIISFTLAACSEEEATPETVEVTRIVEQTVEVAGPEVEVTRIVEVEVTPEPEMAEGVPFQEQWANSPHNDAEAEAFTHWDEDDPAEIPARCAKCHSTPGFIDFVGADGTEAGVVDNAAPLGTTVECTACHNEGTVDMTSVTFPSGAEVMGLGPEARCMQCHQGRASTVQVNESIAEAGLEGQEDTVGEDLGFTNIHYFAAAATQYGTVAMGGYEYEGKSYDSKFDHVAPYDTCVDCHSPHTLEVQLDECTECHTDLEDPEDLVDIRLQGSLVDYDGDGDMEEGIAFEIEDMRTMLYQSMQAYADEVAGAPIVYDTASYPYFFNDSNANGEVDEDEAAFPNAYASWTPRLAKAAYNYQVSLKDPGRYAHGGKYIIQLLYDSIESLNEAVSEPVDLTALRRIDHGHFAGSEEAFRHWDEDGFVSASCSKCHSAAGLPLFIDQGVTIDQPPANGLNCATCHNDVSEFTIYEVTEVEFPSGAVIGFGEDELPSNLCLNCHQGRESTTSVNRLIGDMAPDEVSENLRFLNIHYFAAGATLFGTEAQGAYEYDGQTYVGRNEHVGAFDTCTECHNTHALEVEVEECSDCHENVESFEDLQAIRTSETDYDGDGDVDEGIAGEIETIRGALYAAMQTYAMDTVGTGILYDSHSYPYYFADTNGNGEADADEVNFGNQYNTWTPRLLQAAYNYQYATKDPGGYAHNSLYILQILYDSLNDIGGDTAGMTRPEVPTEG